jgi:hypothetical protein
MDTDALAHAILQLYESEDLRKQIARAGRSTIQSLLPEGRPRLYQEAIGELLTRLGVSDAPLAMNPIPTR